MRILRRTIKLAFFLWSILPLILFIKNMYEEDEKKRAQKRQTHH